MHLVWPLLALPNWPAQAPSAQHLPASPECVSHRGRRADGHLLVAFLGQRCLRHMRRELDEEGLRQKSRAEHFDGYGELVAV